MAAIEFHEVKGPRWDLAVCRAVETAQRRGRRIYLWAESESHARQLDDLLWTFREDSFVAHGLWQGEPGCDEPVAVGWKPGNPNRAACLVLAREVAPEDIGNFEEIVDFAAVDIPTLRQAARERFRAFRAAGFTVRFHPAPR